MAEVKIPGKNYADGDQQHPVKSAKVKKLTTGQKIRKAFIADEINDVKSYAIFDVLIPLIKKALRELITNAFDMTFYGKPQARDRRDGTYYDYSRRDRDRDRDRDDRATRGRSTPQTYVGPMELDRVIFEDKEEAVEAYNYLIDALDQFGVATVSDFLSKAGLSTNPIHSKWGWYDDDMHGACVRQLPSGDWYVDLPKPKSI